MPPSEAWIQRRRAAEPSGLALLGGSRLKEGLYFLQQLSKEVFQLL